MRAAVVAAGDQGLRDQGGQHPHASDVAEAITAHRGHRLPTEAAAEHRQLGEDRLLLRAEPLVAPADQRLGQLHLTLGSDGLQDAELGVQGVGQLGQRVHAGPRRGDLQGQRQTVHPLADPDHGGRLLLVQILGRPGAGQEEPAGGQVRQLGGGGSGGRHLEGNHAQRLLDRQAQGVPADHDHLEPGGPGQQGLDDLGAARQLVLGVVDHHQAGLAPEMINDLLQTAGCGSHPERRGEGGQHRLRLVQRAHGQPVHAVGEPRSGPRGVRDGDPGLADSGWAEHGDQPGVAAFDQLRQCGDLGGPADQRVGEDRQAGRDIRGELRGGEQCRSVDIIQVHRLGQQPHRGQSRGTAAALEQGDGLGAEPRPRGEALLREARAPPQPTELVTEQAHAKLSPCHVKSDTAGPARVQRPRVCLLSVRCPWSNNAPRRNVGRGRYRGHGQLGNSRYPRCFSTRIVRESGGRWSTGACLA